MPVAVTYPGVYVEEIPSSVHTITGAATSIAAFVGWAPQGPTGQAQLVLSWADYSRQFGGLVPGVYLGYAVYQFFTNGGQQAYIVRLVDKDAATATITLEDSKSNAVLTVSALNPGSWASNYAIAITSPPNASTGFGLQVVNWPLPASPLPPVVVESFQNLWISSSSPRFVQAIVNNQSNYITVEVGAGATTVPAAGTTPFPASGAGSGNNGTVLQPVSTTGGKTGDFETQLTGTNGYTLLQYVNFDLLCVPGEADPGTLSQLEGFCAQYRAMLIADCPSDASVNSLSTGAASVQDSAVAGLANAAYYFPWVNAPDPAQSNQPNTFPPSGFAAGLYAQTDAARGVWKAPAGTQVSLTGVLGPSVVLNDAQNGVLNPLAINCIRNFTGYGTVLWGARTLQGSDIAGSQWKYVPVRRMALFLESSLLAGLKWAVFEPNDNPLWSSIRLNVTSFMQTLFLQGAFQGQTPQEAYFVKCDGETTTQADINLGIVNIIVGFAPLQPAEFVVIQIQQMAGQLGA